MKQDVANSFGFPFTLDKINLEIKMHNKNALRSAF